MWFPAFRAASKTSRYSRRNSIFKFTGPNCQSLAKNTYKLPTFPPDITSYTFWLVDRFNLSHRDIHDPKDKTPDTKTLWLFREQFVHHNQIDELFFDFDLQLDAQGFKARKGQIVDASFVSAPKQRNSREENALIKAGETPPRFEENPIVARQKDTDARWTKKNGQSYYGYKNHVNVDNEHKLIRGYEVTSAEAHDFRVFHELLRENTSRDVWADSAYRSEENDRMLAALGHRNRVHRKSHRNKPLSDREIAANHKK